MIKIWNEAVWKNPPVDKTAMQKNKLPRSAFYATIAMVILIVLFGLATGHLSGHFFEAGRQVMDADLYINTVIK